MSQAAAKPIENATHENLPADPMVSMIERVALDPNIDIEKLERMLDMKERLDATNQKRAYAEAMAAAQAEIEPIARNQRNEQTKSNYADLAAIYKQCKPVIAKHGLSFSVYPEAAATASMVGVRWIVRHVDGHSETGQAELPTDDRGIAGKTNKTGIHAFGSTINYARRYLFSMIFDVATEDDDGNAAQANMGAALNDAWTMGILDSLPENASDKDKAQAFANAICRDFKSKGRKALDNSWDKRLDLINRIGNAFPELKAQIEVTYNSRVEELDLQ